MPPRIMLLLLTYSRTEYAEITLRSALDNILYPDTLSVHVADDGSPQKHRDKLVEIAGGYPNVQGVTVTNSERGGYGRNFNLASQVVHRHADYVLCLEDDWRLTRPLDLMELVIDMRTIGCVDCVRLGYLSFTQALHGSVACGPEPCYNKYLLLDPLSPEPHVWAGHPRLETRVRQQECGQWQEGYLPGETEFMMAHVKRSRQGVAWPMDLVHPRGDLFVHIGSERAW